MKISSTVVAAAILGAGAPAFARDTATKADDGSITDIVVTATRREELLNNIPIAAQALSGDALQNLNVTSVDKLIEFLPNVQAVLEGQVGDTLLQLTGRTAHKRGLTTASAIVPNSSTARAI